MSIAPSHPLWSASLGFRAASIPADSLAGLCLRLDLVNGLEAGTTLRRIARHSTGAASLISPGALLTAACFDLEQLASMTALRLVDIERGTLRPVIRSVYAGRRLSSRTFGQRQRFAICPRCIRAQRIPLASLFAWSDGCAEHRLQLANACNCREPIHPFAGQRPFSCHRCGDDYATLPARLLTARRQDDATARATAINVLAELCSDAAPHHEVLRVALNHLLLVRDDSAGEAARRLRMRLKKGTVSIALAVDVLAHARTSTAELRQAARLVAVSLQPRRNGRACSNAACRRSGLCARPGLDWRVCWDCGTRASATRTSFSFDVQPGYPAWRAVRNAERLGALGQAVSEIVASGEGRGLSIEQVFARAGVPRSYSYWSRRAGLVDLARSSRHTYRSPISA